MVYRREFLAASALLVEFCNMPSALALPSDRHIVAGAIRWDGWYRRADNSIPAQDALAPEKFHSRAPLHCVVHSSSEISCIGSQEAMDAEIHAAASSGLSFWAFDWFPAESSLHAAWDLYQRSKYKELISWAGIVGLGTMGSVPFASGNWKARAAEWANYMGQSCYQKIDVGGVKNRPLLFVFWYPAELATYFSGNLSNVKLVFEELKAATMRAGLGEPYIVILDTAQGGQIVEQTGASALSSYASGFRKSAYAPYRSLDEQTRQYWSTLAKTGEPIIPIAMVGWDTRPKMEHPLPWEAKTAATKPDLTQYFVLPTPTELADHIRAATEYIDRNRDVCPSKVLLIYSWDECAEGGGLIPTLGDPAGSYLSAIARVLRARA